MNSKLGKNDFNYSANIKREISYLIELSRFLLINFSKNYPLIDFNQCYDEKMEHLTNLIEYELIEHFVPIAIRRKIISLCQFKLRSDSTLEERLKFMKIAISIGKRVAFEILVKHSDSHKIISCLWSAVRNRGCQFLGPAIQEKVLQLIVLALGDGAQLSRKVLVLYILQQIEAFFPLHSTKTAIGHVVQILYRQSCFELIKRDGEASLMQLKEQYRTYDELRREHDTQIVSIALESGIRLSPEQWSSILYGDYLHKSHMQSIIDKLNATNPPFDKLINQLMITLSQVNDPIKIIEAIPFFENLQRFEQSIENEDTCNLNNIILAIESVLITTIKLILFINFVFNKNGCYSLYKNRNRNHFI